MSDPQPPEYESLETHVSVCAVRYRGLHERLRRIEYVLMVLLGVLVLNGDGPLSQAVFKVVGLK